MTDKKVTIITRWPTAEDAHQDAERVARMLAFPGEVKIQTFTREEKFGGGFGYTIADGGRISIACLAITRYKARYHGLDGHDREVDGLTAEDAISTLKNELAEHCNAMIEGFRTLQGGE